MTQSVRQPREAESDPSRGRRGRPTADRVAAIDSAIKAAALDHFVEVGFEAASMDAIAAGAQVSKSTLYARYPGKEPLFRAVLEEEVERWSQRAGARDHLLTDDLELRLRHHARTFADVFTWPEFQRIASLLDASTRLVPDLAHEWNGYVTERSIDFLRNDMAGASSANVDWDFHARLFLSSISGWHRANLRGGVFDLEGLIAFSDKVIDVMMIAIAHDTPRGTRAR